MNHENTYYTEWIQRYCNFSEWHVIYCVEGVSAERWSVNTLTLLSCCQVTSGCGWLLQFQFPVFNLNIFIEFSAILVENLSCALAKRFPGNAFVDVWFVLKCVAVVRRAGIDVFCRIYAVHLNTIRGNVLWTLTTSSILFG